MPAVRLFDVAIEVKETYKGDKTGCPIVGLEHITPEEVMLSNWSVDTENTFTKIFRRGDMLFGRRRAYLKKAAIAPFDGICSGDITVIRPKSDRLLPELLPFIIQNDDFFEYAVEKSAGSLSPRVKWEHLKNYEFMLPGLEKQKKLADLLWAINDSRRAYQELLHVTDELIKSQFIEMFGDPNCNLNPATLADAFIIRDDLRKPLNDAVRSGMHEGALYPYYGANGQVDTINDFIADYYAICLAEDCGAYCAGEASSYIIRGKAWVNNHAHVLVPRENCNIVYANEFFRLLDITEWINGSTRAKLTQEAMKKLPMLLPPIEQQNVFAELVEQSDKSKFELRQAINDVDSLIRSLVQQELK